MKLLTKEQLQQLTTPRLLAYKNKLMQVPEFPDWDDENSQINDKYSQINKESLLWRETYFALKEILATREHVK